jgi:hypothetical protein
VCSMCIWCNMGLGRASCEWVHTVSSSSEASSLREKDSSARRLPLPWRSGGPEPLPVAGPAEWLAACDIENENSTLWKFSLILVYSMQLYINFYSCMCCIGTYTGTTRCATLPAEYTIAIQYTSLYIAIQLYIATLYTYTTLYSVYSIHRYTLPLWGDQNLKIV